MKRRYIIFPKFIESFISSRSHKHFSRQRFLWKRLYSQRYLKKGIYIEIVMLTKKNSIWLNIQNITRKIYKTKATSYNHKYPKLKAKSIIAHPSNLSTQTPNRFNKSIASNLPQFSSTRFLFSWHLPFIIMATYFPRKAIRFTPISPAPFNVQNKDGEVVPD